jgi:hypothetical protein
LNFIGALSDFKSRYYFYSTACIIYSFLFFKKLRIIAIAVMPPGFVYAYLTNAITQWMHMTTQKRHTAMDKNKKQRIKKQINNAPYLMSALDFFERIFTNHVCRFGRP